MGKLEEIRKREDEFFSSGRRLLTDFQYIEFLLKRYLSLCYEATRQELDGILQYDRNPSKLEKWSLGRLVDEAMIYCNSKWVLTGLKELVQYRNDVAHSVFVDAHQNAFEEGFVSKKIEELNKIKIQAEHVIVCLLDEERSLKQSITSRGRTTP